MGMGHGYMHLGQGHARAAAHAARTQAKRLTSGAHAASDPGKSGQGTSLKAPKAGPSRQARPWVALVAVAPGNSVAALARSFIPAELVGGI
jgi:hypothetical protein